MIQRCPPIGETVFRNGAADWVAQVLLVVGVDAKGEKITEPAVLVWGSTGQRFVSGDRWLHMEELPASTPCARCGCAWMEHTWNRADPLRAGPCTVWHTGIGMDRVACGCEGFVPPSVRRAKQSSRENDA